MARYSGPSCKLCRRERQKLFLKGTKCFTEKCPVERKNYPPGQHGLSRRQKVSDYSVQLREKQKVKRIYGILEKQFRNHFEEVKNKKGIIMLDDLAAWYPTLGDFLKQRYAGWTAFILTGDLRLAKMIGLKPSRRTPLFNGALECRLFRFELVSGFMRKDAPPGR